MLDLGRFPYIAKPIAKDSNDVIMIGTKEYTLSPAAYDFFNNYVSKGDKISVELTDAGNIFRVTVYDGDITVVENDTFEDLVIGGNLTVNSEITLNTKGVTVKGDTVVDGTIVSNTTFEGNVTVNGTATFTNVTIKGDLTVAGTATFVNKVTVAGELAGAENINVDDADEASKKFVEDAQKNAKLHALTFKIKGYGRPQEEIVYEELDTVIADNARFVLENLIALDNLTLTDEEYTEILDGLRTVKFDKTKISINDEGKIVVANGFLVSGWEVLKDERLNADPATGYNVSVFIDGTRYKITIAKDGTSTVALAQ